jgi:hypothetical protein
LPDKRGRVSLSLDTMGGSASGRVSASIGGIDGTTIGAAGGGQVYTMLRSDLPNTAPNFVGQTATIIVTSSDGRNYVAGSLVGVSSGGGGAVAPATGGTVGTVQSSGSFTPVGVVQSLNGGVTQTAMKTMPPAIVVPYLIRII